MSSPHPLVAGAALGALALVSACSSPPVGRGEYIAEAPRYAAPAPVPVYAEYGTVQGIDVIPIASRPSGAGAVLGAVVGAVVGNQFGAGAGRAVATGAGAVGGAVAGNAIESRQRRDDEVYRVTVRFDDGALRPFDFYRVDELRVGDRVKLEGGQIYRM